MKEIFSNAAVTHIAAAASATDLAISIESGANFPTPAAGEFFKITMIANNISGIPEIAYVTGASGTVLTISERGAEGTVAAAVDIGDLCYHTLTAQSASTFRDTMSWYLGAQAADPIAGNSGEALIAGMVYFNSTSNTSRLFNGFSWGLLTNGYYLGPLAADPTLDSFGVPVVEGMTYWSTVDNNTKLYDGTTWGLFLNSYYLGPLAADPTVDSFGNAVVEGMTYFNTVQNYTREYDGVVWKYTGSEIWYLGAFAADPLVDNYGGALVAGQVYYNTTNGVNMQFDGIVWAVYEILQANKVVAEYVWDSHAIIAVGGSLTFPDDYGNSPTSWVASRHKISVSINGAQKIDEIDNAAVVGDYTVDYVNNTIKAVNNAIQANAKVIVTVSDRMPTVSSAITGHKNVIINGRLGPHGSPWIINQREFDGNWAGAVINEYGYDRWYAQSDNPEFILQHIEKANILPNTSYVFHWEGGGIGALNLLHDGGTNQGESPITLISGSNYFGSALTNGVAVPVNATNIQLELGTVPTAFEVRPPAIELSLCQRYGWGISAATAFESFFIGEATSATTFTVQVQFPTTLFSAPTLLTYEGGMHITAAGQSFVISNIVLGESSKNHAILNVTTSGLTPGWAGRLRDSGAATAKIFIQAEIPY